MLDNKAIEIFLERNGLQQTLKSYRSESKRVTSYVKSQNLTNLSKVVIPTDRQGQHALREYLQGTDIKYLRRFVENMRKGSKPTEEDANCRKLSEQPFFRRLVEKEQFKFALHKENMLATMNVPQPLDESRYCQNQWEGENDPGYDMYEFPAADLPKVIREIQSLKNYQITAVKEVPYPEQFYTAWQQTRQTSSSNAQDKLPTRLPPNIIFGKNRQSNEVYPLQSNGVVYDIQDLKVIYDREKTGFEQQRELTIVVNDVLAGRFQIMSVLGQAQFSKAIEVRDLSSPNQKQRFCLKIILNSKDYLDQSLDQIKLLKLIKANCNPDESCLVTMHDYFYHREHLMILTELLKDNLYDAYRARPEYFTLPRVQAITKQILLALNTLHRLHIMHCDLKPENILIKSYSHTQVKVIDIGSSVFFHDQPQFYVQTRSYRAPEIILGCPYTEKIDIWSLGCIVAELYTGQVLFDSENVVGLLARMQGMRGPWPSWMIKEGQDVRKYFQKEMILFEEICEEMGEDEAGKKKKRKTGLFRVYTPKTTTLKARIPSSNKHLLDFLSKCLKLDPSQRLSAKEALLHPFITELIMDEA